MEKLEKLWYAVNVKRVLENKVKMQISNVQQ